jgi:hypothetical protein
MLANFPNFFDLAHIKVHPKMEFCFSLSFSFFDFNSQFCVDRSVAVAAAAAVVC